MSEYVDKSLNDGLNSIKEHLRNYFLNIDLNIENLKNLTTNERTINYLDNDIKSLKTTENLLNKSIEFIKKEKNCET